MGEGDSDALLLSIGGSLFLFIRLARIEEEDISAWFFF
jgi:hypothetical protein